MCLCVCVCALVRRVPSTFWNFWDLLFILSANQATKQVKAIWIVNGIKWISANVTPHRAAKNMIPNHEQKKRTRKNHELLFFEQINDRQKNQTMVQIHKFFATIDRRAMKQNKTEPKSKTRNIATTTVAVASAATVEPPVNISVSNIKQWKRNSSDCTFVVTIIDISTSHDITFNLATKSNFEMFDFDSDLLFDKTPCHHHQCMWWNKEKTRTTKEHSQRYLW